MNTKMKAVASFCIVFLLCLTSVRAGQHFYYKGNTRIDLSVHPGLITIKMADPQPVDWQDLFSAYSDLDNLVPPLPASRGFFKLAVGEGAEVESLVDSLRQDERVLFANNVFVRADSSVIYLSETFTAKFDSAATLSQIDSLNTAHRVETACLLFNTPYFQILRLTADSDLDVLSMPQAYRESGLVVYAHPDIHEKAELCGDPYFQYQWQFHNTGQYNGVPGADIDLLAAKEFMIPNHPLLIALLDTGFEPHEDFPAERYAGGYDYADGDGDWSPDTLSHGMLCLGCFAAVTDNDTGLAGMLTPNYRILAQRVFDLEGWKWSGVEAAISDAVDSGAVIIGNSWGFVTERDTAVTDLIEMGHDMGILFVFAAGNSFPSGAPVKWPAWLDETIAVGASHNTDSACNFSRFGPELDVLAPSGDVDLGVEYWSLDRMGAQGVNDGSANCEEDDPNYYCWAAGTSASSPVVTGIASLILGRRPDLIGFPDTVRSILRYSAEREQYGVQDTSRVDDRYGWGRVNAARALLAVSRGDADNNALVNISDAIYIRNYIFGGGPPPEPTMGTGDVDCNGLVNISDTVYLIAYIFGGGPAPPICYKYDY